MLIMSSLTFIECSRGVQQSPPAYVEDAPPPPPTVRHVWVNGRYEYVGRSYVRRPGYYVVPPRGKKVWHPGGYQQNGRYYRYRKGYWR